MGSAYRDAPPPAEDEELPEFRPRATVGAALKLLAWVGAIPGLVIALDSDHLGAAEAYAVTLAPALVVTAVVMLLQRPVGAWMARRRARRVRRGIIDLEKKVSRSHGS
ncbi:MAG TPA: hypothetical protein VLT33_17045 [Labilithrix sp.]|nr:hypothetical protein [Labilithrix sp.]